MTTGDKIRGHISTKCRSECVCVCV